MERSLNDIGSRTLNDTDSRTLNDTDSRTLNDTDSRTLNDTDSRTLNDTDSRTLKFSSRSCSRVTVCTPVGTVETDCVLCQVGTYIARYWLLTSRFRSDDDRRRRLVAFLSVHCAYVNMAVDRLLFDCCSAG